MANRKSLPVMLATRVQKPKSDPSLVETGPKKGDRLLSKSDVLARVPASYPRIWQMMVAGTFPRSVKLGSRAAWYASEIDSWLINLERTKLKGDEAAS
jgi:predicted DNA-binding transcriptional regulator AlpA